MLLENPKLAGFSRTINNPVTSSLAMLGRYDQVSRQPAEEAAPGEETEQDQITRALRMLEGDKSPLLDSNAADLFIRDGVEWSMPKGTGALVVKDAVQTVGIMLVEQLLHRLPARGEKLTDEEMMARCTCHISLDDYCERRGLKDRKEARKAISEAIRVLSVLKFKYQGEYYYRKRKVSFQARGPVLDVVTLDDEGGRLWKGGMVVVVFSLPFLTYTRKHGYNLMWLSDAIYRVRSDKHPYSRRLGIRLLRHWSMNDGYRRRNIIQVKHLINGLFDLGTRHKKLQIFDPFVRDMDYLQSGEIGLLRSWEPCGQRGRSLTDTEMDRFNYDLPAFLESYIHFELGNGIEEALPARPNPTKRDRKAKPADLLAPVKATPGTEPPKL